jgi:hypothetical protein
MFMSRVSGTRGAPRKQVALIAAILIALSPAVEAAMPYFNGFEADNAGWAAAAWLCGSALGMLRFVRRRLSGTCSSPTPLDKYSATQIRRTF